MTLLVRSALGSTTRHSLAAVHTDEGGAAGVHAESVALAVSAAPATAAGPSAPRRKAALKITLAVLLVAALVTGVAVAIAVVSSSSSRSLNIPETFTANFELSPSDGSNGAAVKGDLHKTLNANGEWVLTGAVVVSNAHQTTIVVAAADGGVYYTVMADDAVVEQSCVDADRGAPHLGALQSVLDSVKSVQDSRDGDRTPLPAGCSPDLAWSFVFQGLPMLICQTQTGAFLVSGPGIAGSVFNIDDSTSWLSPYEPLLNVTSREPMACKQILPVASGVQKSRRLGKTFQSTQVTQAIVALMRPAACVPGSSVQVDPDGSRWCITQHLDGRYRCRVEGSVVTDVCGAKIDPGRDSAHPAEQPANFPAPTPTQTTSSQSRQSRTMLSSTSDVPSSSLPSYRRCVFMHGSGVVPGAASTGMRSTFPEYWGDVHNRVACTERVFLELDTTNQAWDSPQLQQGFCVAAADSNHVIRNTAVFAHGSGNLIVAAAIQGGKCTLDAASSAWLELQASYNAARLAEVAVAVCKDKPHWTDRQRTLNAQQHLCQGDSSAPAVGWASVLSTYTPVGVTWATVASVIKSTVSGAMCGDYSAGLLASTEFSVAPPAQVYDQTDVAWSTCWDDSFRSRFVVDSFSSLFFAPSVNYWDVTCRNGNGMFGSHRRPCDWFGEVSH